MFLRFLSINKIINKKGYNCKQIIKHLRYYVKHRYDILTIRIFLKISRMLYTIVVNK